MADNVNCKILLLCGWYYPDSVGGTETYVHSLGKDLQSLGYDVAIAAPSKNEKESSYIDDGLSIYRYPVALNLTREEVRGSREPKYLDIFKRFVDDECPGIVHIHSFTRGCGLAHAQYVYERSIPLVFTVHTSELTCARGTMMRWGRIPCDGEIRERRCAACYIQKKGLMQPAAWLISSMPYLLTSPFKDLNNRLGTLLNMRNLLAKRKEVVRKLFEITDYTIVVSQWLYDTLSLNGASGSKLLLCRHGFGPMKTEAEKLCSNDAVIVLKVGYIGRFNPVKGVHVLIKALKRLPQNTSIELRIYGRVNDNEDRSYLAYLKRLAAKDKRILFCGELKESLRKKVFSGLDVLAVPSLWLETGPLVVLESKNFKVPVIGSNLGGIAELVNDGIDGMLIEAGNIRMWAKAFTEICLHPDRIKAMAKNISIIRTSKKVAEEMKEIYTSLLDSKEMLR